MSRTNFRKWKEKWKEYDKDYFEAKVKQVFGQDLIFSPRDGFFIVQFDEVYLQHCIISPDVSIIDFRDFNDYKVNHIRTAINIPYRYLNLPTKEQTEKVFLPLEEKKEQVDISFDNFLSEDDMQANIQSIKASWVGEIIELSLERGNFHQLVIYDDVPKSKNSSTIAGVISILKTMYKNYIQIGVLSIVVCKFGFQKFASEKWVSKWITSTETYRLSEEYKLLDNTEDEIYTEVFPFLYLSSIIGATDKQLLDFYEITSIINVTEREIDYPKGNYEINHIYMTDTHNQEALGPIKDAISIIDKEKDNKGRVLVHCKRGQSRSPIICMAYIMHLRQCSALQSFVYLRNMRLWIGPNPSFMRQLILYENYLKIKPEIPFPFHSYSLLESGCENFTESLEILQPESQIIFKMIENKEFEKVLTLIQEKPDYKLAKKYSNAYTPIHALIYQLKCGSTWNDIRFVFGLLINEHSIHYTTFLNETPLHIACITSYGECIKYLLAGEALVDSLTYENKTALHYITSKVLFDKKDINTQNIVKAMLSYAEYQHIIVPDIHYLTPVDYCFYSKSLYTLLIEKLIHETTLYKDNLIDNVLSCILEIFCFTFAKSLYKRYRKTVQPELTSFVNEHVAYFFNLIFGKYTSKDKIDNIMDKGNSLKDNIKMMEADFIYCLICLLKKQFKEHLEVYNTMKLLLKKFNFDNINTKMIQNIALLLFDTNSDTIHKSVLKCISFSDKEIQKIMNKTLNTINLSCKMENITNVYKTSKIKILEV